MLVTDYIVNLGLDAGMEKVKDRVDENKLRNALKNYIERQKKYNEIATIAEEIDFQGLMEYIAQDLMDDVRNRIFNPSSKQRGISRELIISRAVAYSQANTESAKKRVAKCVSDCIDIIREFYASKISEKDYLLATQIVDSVTEEVKASSETIISSVNELSDKVEALNTVVMEKAEGNSSLFSLDQAVILAENGQLSRLGDNLKMLLSHISIYHPYYPNFGYDYVNGTLRSKPLTEVAKKTFPERYVLTGAIRFGDQYYNEAKGNPLDYAYRHQLTITMEVAKAVKYLGNRIDPSQSGVEGLEGNTVLVTPPPFPPAFPVSIKVGEKTFFEYLKLRMQEILDDGTFVIGNREQNKSLYFEVKIHPEKKSRPEFKIRINHFGNCELLNYIKFIKELSEVKDLHIYVLEEEEDIIAGYVNDINYRTGFTSIDEEIDFLERICDIERYFDVELKPNREISNAEYKAVIYISDLIRNDEVKGTWKEATITGILDQHFREELMTMDKELSMLSYVGVRQVDLFGVEFEFRFMQSFKCAYIIDFEKVKQKAEVLDEGDSIKIGFRAGDDKTTISTLRIPENIENAP